MTASPTLEFYDIASGPPVHPFAPNPWKARYALNFKNASYQTKWVELPDVTATRKSLGAIPVRKFQDGTDFYTLPVIKNTSTGEVVGDSFDIAVYLDKLYPDAPLLFPPGSIGLIKSWSNTMDVLFGYNYVPLCLENFPFNPENEHLSKAEFMRRAGRKSWDEFKITDEDRKKLMAQFEVALVDMVKCYEFNGGGPYIFGNQLTHADIIVGGWLKFYEIGMRPEEYQELRGWDGGLLGKIEDALKPYTKKVD